MLTNWFNRWRKNPSTDLVEQADSSVAPMERSAPESPPTCIYQYLLETATVTYQSKAGQRIIELNDPSFAVPVIEKIMAENPDSLDARALDPAGNLSPFVISVCAARIDIQGDKTRTHAIPEAAVLRVMDLNGASSDVVYGHLDPQRVRDSRPSADVAPITGSRLYGEQQAFLHPDAFFDRLQQVNDNLSLDVQGVTAANFTHAVTGRELEAVQKFQSDILDRLHLK